MVTRDRKNSFVRHLHVVRARVYVLIGLQTPFLSGAQGTQESRKFAVNASKRSRGFTMNLEQASRRVEPVRMFTRNGGNFYRVPAVTRNLPATIFRPRAFLRKCTPRIYYVFRASWTYILRVCFALQFAPTRVAQNRFLRNIIPSLPALLQVISKQLNLRFIPKPMWNKFTNIFKMNND